MHGKSAHLRLYMKQKKQILTAEQSQDSQHQKHFKNDDLNKAAKKMVDDPAADNGRYG